MKINNCLILAAGFGTRMGLIGERLPKVLWPIFERRLIDLQIGYAKKLGCKKIFVNVHFQADQIEKYISENHTDVTILYEKEILRIGGAIHNLKKNSSAKGELLVLNGDQFYWFDQKYFEEALNSIKRVPAVLFGIEVGSGYNEIELQGPQLVGINVNCSKDRLITYSGVSLINLDLLNVEAGPSNFFDTVANYRLKKVLVITPQKADYFDFGTAERYFYEMFRLLKMRQAPVGFIQFCVEMGVFLRESSGGAYNDPVEGIINLSSQRVERKGQGKAIVLRASQGLVVMDEQGIVYDDLFQPISADS